jgi:hypothetical protein
MKKSKTIKKSKTEADIHDDYASLTVGDLRFYFGYEETYCPKHGINDSEKCFDANCYKYEDCFVVTRNVKGKTEELMRIPANKLQKAKYGYDDVETYLLLGIGNYLSTKND